MAHSPSGLIYVLDENFGNMATLLRQSRAAESGSVRTLPELGIERGTLDPDVLRGVGQSASRVLLTRDGRMLGPAVQREAWRTAGITLFMFGRQWGTLPLGELARRMVFLWPAIVEQAGASAAGAAWRVSHSIPSAPASTFRLVTERFGGG